MDNVDFLPDRVRDQRARRRRLFRQAYLLAICAVGLLALGYLRQDRVQNAKADVSSLQQCSSNMQREAARRGTLELQLADLALKKQVEDHLGSRISVQVVMAELQAQVPAGVSLMKLDLETLEIEPPKRGANVSVRAAISGSAKKPEGIKRLRLTLTGLAPTDVDVANFIGQLSASPLFEQVSMGYTRNVVYRGRQAREFAASCLVVR